MTVTNDGFFGFDFGGVVGGARAVVVDQSGKEVFNKKLDARIFEAGVTHDERVIWFRTGGSYIKQKHGNSCLCVLVPEGKLICTHPAFPGVVEDSGIEEGEHGTVLFLRGSWESRVCVSRE